MSLYPIRSFLGFILLSFMGMFNPLYAQNTNGSVKIWGIENTLPFNLKGPLYLQDTWSYGTLFFKNGDIAKRVKLRFNIVTGNLIFYHEKFQKYYIVDKNTIDSFILNDALNSYFEKYDGKTIGLRVRNDDFVEVLYKNKAKLVVKHTAIISEQSGEQGKSIIIPKHFYILQIEGKDIEIRLTPHSLYSIFPDRKKEIRRIEGQLKYVFDPQLKMVRLLEFLGV